MDIRIEIALMSILGTLIAALLVWLLNEFSYYNKERFEIKKATGEALTVLLEIRHRFLILADEQLIDRAINKFCPHPRLAPHFKKIFGNMIPQMLPPVPEHLKIQYAEAIRRICGLNPTVGFYLISKDLVEEAAKKAFYIMNITMPDETVRTRLRAACVLDMKKALEEAINKLLLKHDKKTKAAVAEIFSKNIDDGEKTSIEKEINDMLKPEIISQISKSLENVSDEEITKEIESLQDKLLIQ